MAKTPKSNRFITKRGHIWTPHTQKPHINSQLYYIDILRDFQLSIGELSPCFQKGQLSQLSFLHTALVTIDFFMENTDTLDLRELVLTRFSKLHLSILYVENLNINHS